jgi:hypothetical protein
MTFLPDVVGMVFQKDVTQNSITEAEAKAIVAVAFRSTINKFARDTRTLRQRIPIHLFENSRYYVVEPNDGYFIHEIEQVYEHNAPFPAGAIVNQKSIQLANCPEADLDNAWMVEISVIPSGIACEVEEEYCFRHYEAILNGIIHRLAAQKARTYFDQDLSDRALSIYNQEVRTAEREQMNLLATDAGAAKFFPAILNGLIDESKRVHIRNHELMSIVTTAYRDTVVDVATQNMLLHRTIMISLYKGTTYYPIDVGADATAIKVVDAVGVNVNIPEGTRVTTDAIIVPCCVLENVDNAFQVTMAIAPTRRVCSFNEAFVDKHYESILSGIRYRIAIQGGPEWSTLGRVQILKQEYQKRIAESKRIDVGLSLKKTQRRLSDDH